MREGVQHRARLLARNRNHDRAPSKRNGKMLGVPSRRLPRHLSPALKPSRAAEGHRGWTLPEEGGKESAYPPRGARGRKSTRWRGYQSVEDSSERRSLSRWREWKTPFYWRTVKIGHGGVRSRPVEDTITLISLERVIRRQANIEQHRPIKFSRFVISEVNKGRGWRNVHSKYGRKIRDDSKERIWRGWRKWKFHGVLPTYAYLERDTPHSSGGDRNIHEGQKRKVSL